MKNIGRVTLFTVTLMLVFSSVSFAQTAAANKSWNTFWAKFSAAVKKKDKITLKKLMDPDFFGGVGAPPTRSGWILFIDNNNLWGELQKSVSVGTVSTYTFGRGNSGGMINYKIKRLARKTRDDELLFEYYKQRWWFVSVRSGE